jgi:hypothetical protein
VAAEHDRPDLARPHRALAVERDRERLPGVLQRRDVRQQPARVDEDRVPADREDDGNACAVECLAEIGRRPDPVAQVVLLHDLLEPLREGFEVAPARPP